MYTIEKVNYKYIQLIPVKSNRNTQVNRLIELVNTMNNKSSVRLDKEARKVVITQSPKLSFYIHTTSESVRFYLIVPELYYSDVLQMCRIVWKNIQIDEVDDLPIDINSMNRYELGYKYDDCLSTSVDMRTNALLNNNLTCVSSLGEEDVVGILYNFIPTSNKESNYFHTNSSLKIDKYIKGGNLKKSIEFKDYALSFMRELMSWINEILNVLVSTKKKDFEVATRKLSKSTIKKATDSICRSQILICVKSNDTNKTELLSRKVYNSYSTIANDNEFTFTRVTKPIDIKRTIIPNVKVNKTGTLECSNFIGMPSVDIIKQFNLIQHNKVLQLDAPTCLLDGEILIGEVRNKESSKPVYYSMDVEYRKLGRVLLGSMGCGKSQYMSNLARNIVKTDRGLVVIDYIDTCQLSESIKSFTPKSRIVEIDCSNAHQLQSFSFNEIVPKSNEVIDRVSASMKKGQQVQLLLDSINDDNSQLSPRMVRYLVSACAIKYYVNPFASLKEVIDLMKYPTLRQGIIAQLNPTERELLGEEIEDLIDLDKKDTKGNVSNYDSKVDGILDRIAWLKTNLFTKLAYLKTGNNNINITDELKKSKVILIKIPEAEFNLRMIRNVIATFFLSKVWISKQMDSSTQTELFIDEIHQCHNCQLLMQNILVEYRKFNLTPTLALHYLGQLTPKTKSSLLSSGASFLLMSGCEISVFKDLAYIFEPAGYTEIDLSELDRYNALCAIKNEDTGYSCFTCKY